MDSEILKAIKAVNDRVTEMEQKLDNYFLSLHQENSKAIDEILVSMLEDKNVQQIIQIIQKRRAQ